MKKMFIRIMSIAMVAALMFSLCSCTTTVEEEELKRASATPQTKDEIFDYFNKAMDIVRENNPAVSYSLSEKAGSADCENSHIKSAFKTIAGFMTNGEGESTEYGEDCSSIFPVNGLSINDIKSANIVDIDETTNRSYVITFTLWEESNPVQDGSTFGKLYKIKPKKDILEELKKGSDFFTVEDYDSQYQVGKITAVVLKENDHLSEVSLEREVRISTEITGQNTLASVGTVPLSFTYSSTAKYAVDWNDPSTPVVES